MIHRINKISEFNLKSRRHAIKRLAVDAEDFGGAFTIVAGGFEYVEDVATLDLIEIRQAGKELIDVV